MPLLIDTKGHTNQLNLWFIPSSKLINACNKTVCVLTCGVSPRYAYTARSTRPIPVPWSYNSLVHPPTGNTLHSPGPISSSLTFSQSCILQVILSIQYHSGLPTRNGADNCGCLHNPLSNQPRGHHMGITGHIISNHRRHPRLNSHTSVCISGNHPAPSRTEQQQQTLYMQDTAFTR